MDVTAWLAWFLATLHRAVDQAHAGLDKVLAKSQFWQHWAMTPMNERQVKLLYKLVDGFEGKLTSAKWAKLACPSRSHRATDSASAASSSRFNCSSSGASRWASASGPAAVVMLIFKAYTAP